MSFLGRLSTTAFVCSNVIWLKFGCRLPGVSTAPWNASISLRTAVMQFVHIPLNSLGWGRELGFKGFEVSVRVKNEVRTTGMLGRHPQCVLQTAGVRPVRVASPYYFVYACLGPPSIVRPSSSHLIALYSLALGRPAAPQSHRIDEMIRYYILR